MRKDVGAVGARLYYEDDTIQHAGVVIGFGGIAGHCFVQQKRGTTAYGLYTIRYPAFLSFMQKSISLNATASSSESPPTASNADFFTIMQAAVNAL